MKKYFTLCILACVAGFFFYNLLVAALNQNESNTINETCIGCHVSTFNDGINRPHQHLPFWERRCATCHLADNASSPSQDYQSSTKITGTVVAQEDLWRKVQIFPGADQRSFENLAVIPGLGQTSDYRFRIAVSPLAANGGGEVTTSLWLGLRVEDIEDSNATNEPNLTVGLTGPISDFINTVTLYRDGNNIFIGWENPQLLYGWVELQELKGLDLTALSPVESTKTVRSVDTEQHLPLKDPETTAIVVCYECHPTSSLGTSHPVRLYSGRDVEIPSSLPTVNGMLTCVTCHDPHGAEGKMLVRETIKTKLCVACHIKFKNRSKATMFD